MRWLQAKRARVSQEHRWGMPLPALYGFAAVHVHFKTPLVGGMRQHGRVGERCYATLSIWKAQDGSGALKATFSYYQVYLLTGAGSDPHGTLFLCRQLPIPSVFSLLQENMQLR